METHLKEIRIPRPYGCSNLAIMGKVQQLNETLAKEYIRGNFPAPGHTIPLATFRQQYNIPHHIMQSAITDAFTISPSKLMERGTHALEKALNILAQPQAKASRLTTFLENKVYNSPTSPGHLLVQNLIGSINLERQGADAIVRFLEKAMASDLVLDAQTEDFLTVEQALLMISEDNLARIPTEEGKHRDTGIKDLTYLEEHLAEHPEIPDVRANITEEVLQKKLPRVNSDYNKRKDVSKPSVIQPPTISPI